MLIANQIVFLFSFMFHSMLLTMNIFEYTGKNN